MSDQTALVTGGSRGLGLGVVEALVAAGAKVAVVARGERGLDAVKRRLGVSAVRADVTDKSAALSILATVRPTLLVLNAGATPPMGGIDDMSWEDFSWTWNNDVKAGLYWIQAALKLPLAPGARVLVASSGAAQSGSPLSGGYAGAKRMLWFMANYANSIASQSGLGIRFQAILAQQIVGGTGVGDEASAAYAARAGLAPADFLARFGRPMPPRTFGDLLVSMVQDPHYSSAQAVGLKGDTGVTILEERAAS